MRAFKIVLSISPNQVNLIIKLMIIEMMEEPLLPKTYEEIQSKKKKTSNLPSLFILAFGAFLVITAVSLFTKKGLDPTSYWQIRSKAEYLWNNTGLP